MDNKPDDIRYKQRFQNFSRAYNRLKNSYKSIGNSEYTELELAGITKLFELTFELSWNLLRDYLDYSGVYIELITPRNIIKECANKGLFKVMQVDGNIYLNMLQERNVLSHQYDYTKFLDSLNNIKQLYLPELEKIYVYFLNKEFGNE